MNDNLNSRVVISNNILDDLIKDLSTKFLYQNIMIISSNSDYYSERLRSYRNQFNFVCYNNFEFQLLENTKCVVLIEDKINSTNIEICNEYNIPVFFITNSYLSFYNFCITNNNLLMRVIINKDEYQNNLRCNKCKMLIDDLLINAILIEDNLKNLFYNKGDKFLDLESLTNKERIKNLKGKCFNNNEENIILYLLKNKPSSLHYFSFTFLIVQIIFNLYKIFLANIQPTLVGKVNDFNFDYNKFWFIKNMCYCEIDNQIDYFLNKCIKTKVSICCENIDYFYSIAKQYNNLEIKDWLKNCVKNYENGSLLKIIHNMGLLEF